MSNSIKDLLLVQSLTLGDLIEQYRLFFIALLPSVFIVAVIVEYLDRLEPFALMKRVFISILILVSVTEVYESSIAASIESADEFLATQKSGNILLMDMMDGAKSWWDLNSKLDNKKFYKDSNLLTGTLSFLKYHLFDSFVNDGLTVSVYFITKLCFVILKVVYSLVYYLGYGLIGIPCLIYLFPSMGNVLRGGIFSFIWCLIVPHVLVFVISLIGSEINKGYSSGHIIGGSLMGTTLLFVLSLFIAFTPLIAAMILNGSGISQAGGIIATMGANYVMNLPKNAMNSGAILMSGGALGPKMTFANKTLGGAYKVGTKGMGFMKNGVKTNFGAQDNTHKTNWSSNARDFQSKNTFQGTGNEQSFQSSYNAKAQGNGQANRQSSTKSHHSNYKNQANSKQQVNPSQSTTRRSHVNGNLSKHSQRNRVYKKANTDNRNTKLSRPTGDRGRRNVSSKRFQRPIK